jgi:hypothetical protein
MCTGGYFQRCAGVRRTRLPTDTPDPLASRRFKNAICSSGVILLSSLLVATRQRREAAIASKVFFLIVAMDKEGWRYYAQSWIALQEIHGVKAGFPAHVGEVLKIPAHKVFDAGHRADSDMPGIVGVPKRHHFLRR